MRFAVAGALSFVHPLLDGTAGHVAWTETLADRVYYSEGLAGFLAWSLGCGLRPVLMTVAVATGGRMLVKGVRG